MSALVSSPHTKRQKGSKPRQKRRKCTWVGSSITAISPHLVFSVFGVRYPNVAAAFSRFKCQFWSSDNALSTLTFQHKLYRSGAFHSPGRTSTLTFQYKWYRSGAFRSTGRRQASLSWTSASRFSPLPLSFGWNVSVLPRCQALQLWLPPPLFWVAHPLQPSAGPGHAWWEEPGVETLLSSSMQGCQAQWRVSGLCYPACAVSRLETWGPSLGYGVWAQRNPWTSGFFHPGSISASCGGTLESFQCPMGPLSSFSVIGRS